MKLSRREALAGAGLIALGGGVYLLVRDGDDGDAPRKPASDGATATSGDPACVLAPEQTEGPFYVPDSLVRRDITEGREGVPLELRLKVQEAERCEPIRDATVEVWHCDASGAYSGFSAGGSSEEESFLRGAQRSDASGEVRFTTIYPGWYQGRTVHIHVKVHAGGDEVHTGQLYFDDALTSTVFERSPYASRGPSQTTNAQDGIYDERSTLELARAGDGYRGTLTLGVRVA